MSRNPLLGALALLPLATGCYSVRGDFFPVQSDAPFVYDIGELRVIGADEFKDAIQDDPTSIPDALHYGRLGAGEDLGLYGGATFEFQGTGSSVCVVADPEAVFWNREQDVDAQDRYKYDDIYTDDGDVDVSVGLSAYYTGSPGVEIGDFEAEYTDPAGVDHQIEFNECIQYGYFGDPAHAGRATVEFCSIDTSLHPGVMYTTVLKTFSLPIDDSILNFGTMVFDGLCQNLPWFDDTGAPQTGATECVIPNEVEYSDPNGLPEDKQWFPELESEFCTAKRKLNTYCEENPGEGCTEPTDVSQ